MMRLFFLFLRDLFKIGINPCNWNKMTKLLEEAGKKQAQIDIIKRI